MSNNINSITDWDNEYARLARRSSQLRATTGGSATPSVNNSVENQEQQRVLMQELYRLEQYLQPPYLSPLTQSIPITEIQRRVRLIQHLQSQHSGSGGTAGTTALGGDGSNSMYHHNNNSTQPQYQQQQQSSLIANGMRQQDQMLDELATGMNRLKHQSLAIGEEAKLHVNLLNDMDYSLDQAQSSLDQETRRATRLRNDQSVWKLQLIVAGLFLLLILLILIGFS